MRVKLKKKLRLVKRRSFIITDTFLKPHAIREQQSHELENE